MEVEVAAAMAAAVDVEVAAMEAATAMAEEVVMEEEGVVEDMVAVATQVGMLKTSPPSPPRRLYFLANL